VPFFILTFFLRVSRTRKNNDDILDDVAPTSGK
jgi:hypothetical protein